MGRIGFELDIAQNTLHNYQMLNFETGKKHYQVAAISFFAVLFFLQMFSFIFSNEINGIHFGKRRARLSPPVKQSVAFQMKYETLEDISVGSESLSSENPVLKLNGFSRRTVIENSSESFSNSKYPRGSSSTPPLFTLYRIFRI